MSAKRRALKQITRDNWEESDDEDATNESFISNKDEMKNRKILTAKRRSGSSAQNTPAHKTFDDLKDKTNNFYKANGDSPQPIKQDILNHEEKEIIEFYYSCLEKLNSSICEWVDKCVKATPRGDLSPIFSNYFKHIKELKDKLNIECITSKEATLLQKNQEQQPFWTSEIQNTKGPPYIAPVNSQIDIGFFKQAVSSAIHNETSNKISSINSFANFNTLSQSQNIYDRNILLKEPATSLVSSALPNASKPFSFSFTSNQMSVPNATPTTNTFNFMAKVTPFKASAGLNGKATAEDSGDDGSATAPDPESNEPSDYVPTANPLNLPPALDPNKPAWEEQGAFYVRRCKLFRKEGPHFAEQGLGFAYVKDLGAKAKAPPPSNQLLIRADNASGTVLLNAAVPPNTPVTLSGKSGVLLVVPGTKGVHSDGSKADLKPVTYLVRVKTSEDAKELRDALLTNNLD